MNKNSTNNSVMIVGGGIAGLTAGVYALQSGFDVTIIESHSIAGGNATSWKRKGYFFEGGMHWLTGSSGKTPLNALWKEIGALKENSKIDVKDPFLTYMGKNGQVCIYRDPAKLRKHFLKISPQDKKAINGLVKDIKTMRKLSMPVMDIKGVKVKNKAHPPLSMLFALPKVIPLMKRIGKITIKEYTNKFKSPDIRALLTNVVSTDEFSSEFSSISFLATLGSLSLGDGGYSEGGALRLALNITNEFVRLGGKIEYNTNVEKIHTQNGKATGVIINGQLRAADAVIVAADTRAAIDNLFDSPIEENWANEMRQNIEPVNCSFISLGVKADLSAFPENMCFKPDAPIEHCGRKYEFITFNNYAGYRDYSPEGCSSVTVILSGDTYDEWKEAKASGTYEEKKAQLAQIMIEKLAELIPQTKDKVEVWDVATPLTYERYCGNWRGSWMSVMGTGGMKLDYPCKPETIKNLYFAGQRLRIPGGLPVALFTGRSAAQYLCKDTKTVFQGNME